MDSQAFVPPESFVYSDDGSNRWTGDPQLLSAPHSDFQSEFQQFDPSDLFTNDQYKSSDIDYEAMAQIMQQPFRPRPQEMYNPTFTYNTTARTRPAEPTGQPYAKRARFEEVPVERCYSQTGSQSTCCSSCSDGIICTKPGCDEGTFKISLIFRECNDALSFTTWSLLQAFWGNSLYCLNKSHAF